MIDSIALAMLEKTINYALALDPGSQQALQPWQHKTIEIKCDPSAVHFAIHIDAKDLITLHPSPTPNNVCDLTVSGTVADYIHLLQHRHDDQPLQHCQLQLVGNEILFFQLLAVFNNLDVDYEDGLSRVFGDVAAPPIASGLRKAAAWHRRTSQHVHRALSDYLMHEVELLPSQEEFLDFKQQIAQLNEDVRALTKQIDAINPTAVQSTNPES